MDGWWNLQPGSMPGWYLSRCALCSAICLAPHVLAHSNLLAEPFGLVGNCSMPPCMLLCWALCSTAVIWASVSYWGAGDVQHSAGGEHGRAHASWSQVCHWGLKQWAFLCGYTCADNTSAYSGSRMKLVVSSPSFWFLISAPRFSTLITSVARVTPAPRALSCQSAQVRCKSLVFCQIWHSWKDWV